MSPDAEQERTPEAPREHVDAAADLRDRRYWERKCASRKHGDVCNLLGADYEQGGDTPWGFFPQDFELAARAYARGCEQGDMDSCGSSARLMIFGKPVRNLEKGARLAHATCGRGHADSCGLAGMTRAIESQTLDAYQEGLALLDRGCRQGGLNACNYLRGFRTNQPSDRPPPIDAYGLPFVAQPFQAAAWCEQHGYRVERSAGDLRCRNSSGFAEYILRFNGETLNAVMALRPAGPDADAWVTAFKSAVRKMGEAYGPPTSLLVSGGDCATHGREAQLQCLDRGEIKIEAAWGWSSNRFVSVGVNWFPNVGPLLVVYLAPGIAG